MDDHIQRQPAHAARCVPTTRTSGGVLPPRDPPSSCRQGGHRQLIYVRAVFAVDDPDASAWSRSVGEHARRTIGQRAVNASHLSGASIV